MQTVTRESIQELLRTNDKAVVRAVSALYQRQTSREKLIGGTESLNNVGFNSADGHILSSFAEQIQRGRTLSPKQIYIARKAIYKYAGQLVEIAREKAQTKSPESSELWTKNGNRWSIEFSDLAANDRITKGETSKGIEAIIIVPEIEEGKIIFSQLIPDNDAEREIRFWTFESKSGIVLTIFND